MNRVGTKQNEVAMSINQVATKQEQRIKYRYHYEVEIEDNLKVESRLRTIDF